MSRFLQMIGVVGITSAMLTAYVNVGTRMTDSLNDDLRRRGYEVRCNSDYITCDIKNGDKNVGYTVWKPYIPLLSSPEFVSFDNDADAELAAVLKGIEVRKLGF